MGFTRILLLAYLAFLLLDIVALMNKKWGLFIAITAVMAIGIILLGYLWVTSPN